MAKLLVKTLFHVKYVASIWLLSCLTISNEIPRVPSFHCYFFVTQVNLISRKKNIIRYSFFFIGDTIHIDLDYQHLPVQRHFVVYFLWFTYDFINEHQRICATFYNTCHSSASIDSNANRKYLFLFYIRSQLWL